MTSLETRYRRLLRVYPAGHRADYEEEMIGVLMSGAGSGRRFPAPAEAADLLRAGLTARLGHTWQTQRRTGWRDAAAVVALLSAVFLAALALRRLGLGLVSMGADGDPMQASGVDGLLLLDVAARSVAWSLVALAALLGRRRVTAAAAVFAAAVEIAAQVSSAMRHGDFLLSWHLAGVLLALACALAAMPAAQAGVSLGRSAVGAVTAAAAAALLVNLPAGIMPQWLARVVSFDALQEWGLPSPAFLAVTVLLVVALRGLTAPVRRRVLVLLTPAFALVLLKTGFGQTYRVLEGFGDPLVVQAVLGLVVAAATLVVGLAVLGGRERRERRGENRDVSA